MMECAHCAYKRDEKMLKKSYLSEVIHSYGFTFQECGKKLSLAFGDKVSLLFFGGFYLNS